MGASGKPDRATRSSTQAPTGLGHSAGIPSADGSNWTSKTVAVWREWSFGRYRAFKTTFYGPWNLADELGVILTDYSLQTVMAHAAAIEARKGRDPQGLGAKHESAVPKGAAQTQSGDTTHG
jgi:hypothetical protein